MTHPQQKSAEQQSAFTITQVALGSPLQFEPALGSIELDNLINNYVPGTAMPQQKRAQVVLEFLNSIDALCYTHPVSIRYHVPQVLTPHNMSRISSMPSLSAPSSGATIGHTVGQDKLVTSKSTGALKRSREEAALPNPSSAKRLPGFSILTKDGVDITDLASRGPKTKEQRDHAALMRKLKACAACKKSKQRCDPRHHRSAQPALGSPSSATPSSTSARLSSISSVEGSLGSISPQSSLGESFSQSPPQSFAAHIGHSFLPRPRSKPLPLPSGTIPTDTVLTDLEPSALPIHDIGAEFFQLADMELDSWNTDFTTFPTTNNDYVWDSHQDVFAQNYDSDVSPTTQGHNSREKIRSNTLPNENMDGEQVQSRQDQGRQAGQHGPVVRSNAYSDLGGIEFDINHWLNSTATGEDRKSSLSQGGAFGQVTSDASQQGLQNPTFSRQQDYILYPESTHFEWNLEPHQISQDIGSQRRSQRPGAESGPVEKDRIDKPGSFQDYQGIISTLERTSESNYSDPNIQSTHILTSGEQYRYLPSPSPSGGSEDAMGFSSDTNISDEEANAPRRTPRRRSEQLYSTPSASRHSGRALMDAVLHQRDISVSECEGIGGIHSNTVHRPHLSPGEPHNLRPVIAAGVDVGSQIQPDLSSHTQFAHPQAQNIQQPLVDVQTHSTDSLAYQQSQQTLLNRESQILPLDHQQWQRAWTEDDLRRGRLLSSNTNDDYSSWLISSHLLTQAPGHSDDPHQGHRTESRQESWRTPISSDIPGEDERQNVSVETATERRPGLSHGDLQGTDIQSHKVARSHLVKQQIASILSQNTKPLETKRSTNITLYTLIAISVLWTMYLLAITGDNWPGSSISPYQSPRTETLYSRNMTQVSSVSSQYDQESFSVWRDQEFIYQSNTRPKPDHISLLIDSFHSRSVQVYPMESNQNLNSRPESESIPVADTAAGEVFPDQWEKQTSSSPSFTGGVSSMSISTMAPSTTKCATTWTMHIPARSTLPPKETHSDVTVKSQVQVAIRSPSPRILTDLLRKWNPPFSVGHLTMRITSLNLS